MKFGKSAAEAADDNRAGGGDYMRALKDGDQTLRCLQEIDDWQYYWEHFNPSGYSFPCPRGVDDPVDMCPGCSSEIEKMAKVSRKWAFNALISFNGQDYVTVYKVPNAVYDKLKNRFGRFGTITDRDYTITRYKTAGDRYDFDVEGSTPTPINLDSYELKSIEDLLTESYKQSWGDGSTPKPQPVAVKPAAKPSVLVTPAVQPQDPPFEPEKTYQEADLRAMERDLLITTIEGDMHMSPPTSLKTTDAVVDWLMQLQS